LLRRHGAAIWGRFEHQDGAFQFISDFEAIEPMSARPMAQLGERTALANAPCSFGAFEVTVGTMANVPEALDLLDAVAGAGYEGIDLGPVGYLGLGRPLASRLAARNLSLAGGYLGLPFSEDDAFNSALPSLTELIDVFDAVPSGTHPPRPTLADAGSPQRAAQPGGSALDRSIGLSDDGWSRFAENLNKATDYCRARGYEPTFHHHVASHVEAPWEIERMLELTDVGLCLDTGHLLLGRGDPVQSVRDWGERINHVHVKDARQAVIDGIIADAAPVIDVWKRRAFCPLGEGDVDIDGVFEALEAIGYSGWIVIEQDMLPELDESPQVAEDEQRSNREYLSLRGL